MEPDNTASSSRRPPRYAGGSRRAQVIARAERRGRALAALASTRTGLEGLDRRAALSAVDELQRLVEELRAADEELRAQNDELETALRCAQSEHARAYQLFESAPIALLHTDIAGVIREANRNAEALIGRERGHLREMPLLMFVHRSDRRAFRDRLRRVQADGGPHTWESIIVSAQPPALGTELGLRLREVRPVAVLVTAEADRPDVAADGPPPPVGIRWALQDFQGLAIAEGDL